MPERQPLGDRNMTNVEVKETTITRLGRFTDDPEIRRAFNPDGISAEAVTLSRNSVEGYVNNLPNYYTITGPGAAIRCGDGRPSEDISGISDASGLENIEVGPQVLGGSFAASLPYRLAKGRATSKHRAIDDFIELSRATEKAELPYSIGAHTSDHAPPGRTGCGKIDSHPDTLRVMSDPYTRPVLRDVAFTLLKDDVDPASFAAIHQEIIDELEHITQPQFMDFYLHKDDGDYLYRDVIMAGVEERSGPEAIQTMRGDHKEIILAVNKKSGRTFNNTLFAYDSGNEAQAFNIDYWHMVDEAQSLFPHSQHQRDKFLTAYVMDQLATGMVLTAGDQEVVILN
jgi:hypothetical protein